MAPYEEIKKAMAPFKNYSNTLMTISKLPLKTPKTFFFTLHLQIKIN